MGQSNAAELRRQTPELHDQVKRRRVDVTLDEFKGSAGADARCQVNNPRLANAFVFDWLDRTFGWSGDSSMGVGA